MLRTWTVAYMYARLNIKYTQAFTVESLCKTHSTSKYSVCMFEYTESGIISLASSCIVFLLLRKENLFCHVFRLEDPNAVEEATAQKYKVH